MNHAITVGELLRAIGGIIACLVILLGVLMFLAGSMSDAPAEGDASGRTGCTLTVIGIIAIVLLLAACAHTPAEPRIQTIETKVPVAVQPIKSTDIPPLPQQLGPRPSNAQDAADVALAGRCDAIAFVIRAYPLLLLAAGLPPVQAPVYEECKKH